MIVISFGCERCGVVISHDYKLPDMWDPQRAVCYPPGWQYEHRRLLCSTCLAAQEDKEV